MPKLNQAATDLYGPPEGRPRRPSARRRTSAVLVGLHCLLSCGGGEPLAPDTDGIPSGPRGAAEVRDLTVVASTPNSLTLRWTEVDDGVQGPASYRIKYGPTPFEWTRGTIGCDPTLSGNEVGATMSCVIEGLVAGLVYDVQAMSFRVEEGEWAGATYSNIARGVTSSTSGSPPTQARDGIWVGRAELAALPMAGPSWENVRTAAEGTCDPVNLADQDDDGDVCVMAKALAYARTGDWSHGIDVLTALEAIAEGATYQGTALALGRSLVAYVIAADLIDLATAAPTLDAAFRATLRELMSTPTTGGPTSLVVCHETRPNNWGTHCGASRAAIAAYLGDDGELWRVAQVFRGWLGDRATYAGFDYGDTSWQCDPERPVGINPSGCSRGGYEVGGVLPDDQRRSGALAWPPARENYVWEALQGAVVQAVLLERAGYRAFEWQDRALLRAITWLYEVADYPAEGDDIWQVHLINHFYASSIPAAVPARPGKNVGWSDWTHGR